MMTDRTLADTTVHADDLRLAQELRERHGIALQRRETAMWLRARSVQRWAVKHRRETPESQ